MRIIAYGILFLIALSPFCPAGQTQSAPPAGKSFVLSPENSVDRFGNLILPVGIVEAGILGIKAGDVIEATLPGRTMDARVVESFSGARPGECVFVIPKCENGLSKLGLAFKNFHAEIVEPSIAGKGSFRVSIRKKGECASDTGNIVRSMSRKDYPGHTDREFANFREIIAPNIASGLLFRSSSPIDPALGRDKTALGLLSECGIKTIWNMALTHEEALRFLNGENREYFGKNVLFHPLNADFVSRSFREGVKKGLLHILSNPPPVLIHCKEGKDRTAFVAILLEALGGGCLPSIKEDFILSYRNYFFNADEAMAGRIFDDIFTGVFGINPATQTGNADLSQYAVQYLRDCGMAAEEVERLKSYMKGGSRP